MAKFISYLVTILMLILSEKRGPQNQSAVC